MSPGGAKCSAASISPPWCHICSSSFYSSPQLWFFHQKFLPHAFLPFWNINHVEQTWGLKTKDLMIDDRAMKQIKICRLARFATSWQFVTRQLAISAEISGKSLQLYVLIECTAQLMWWIVATIGTICRYAWVSHDIAVQVRKFLRHYTSYGDFKYLSMIF